MTLGWPTEVVGVTTPRVKHTNNGAQGGAVEQAGGGHHHSSSSSISAFASLVWSVIVLLCGLEVGEGDEKSILMLSFSYFVL
jgi:hypothetical protein